jgi:hypothetical protein
LQKGKKFKKINIEKLDQTVKKGINIQEASDILLVNGGVTLILQYSSPYCNCIKWGPFR